MVERALVGSKVLQGSKRVGNEKEYEGTGGTLSGGQGIGYQGTLLLGQHECSHSVCNKGSNVASTVILRRW